MFSPSSGSMRWPGDTSPPGVVPIDAPPTGLRLAYRAIGWRLPEQYRPWVAQDIESGAFMWYHPARVLGFAFLGLLIRFVVDEIVLFTPTFNLRGLTPVALFLLGLMGLGFVPAYIASRRRKVRRWQGLEGQTRGSNGTMVGFLVLFQVAVVGLAFGGANAVHGRTCGGAGTSPAVDLQGLIRDPAGYQAVPIGTGGTGALTASDAANLFADPSKERQVLDCNGFQTGYLKAWNASNPNRGISVKLYEFSGANGATAFRNTDERSTAAAAGAVRKDFGGDTTVITPGVDRSGNYFGYDFATVGRIVAVVRMFRSDAAPSTDELHALMQDQQAQIGAGGSSA